MSIPKRRWTVWTPVAAAVIAALTLVPASPAAADDDTGDRYRACNRGEICFFWNSTLVPEEDNPTRQFFWNDSNHRGNFFSNDSPLYRNAIAYANRDTQCGVWVLNFNSLGQYVWGFGPNDGVYRNMSPGYQHTNVAHYRCNRP
jgi:hypothetical protein